MTELKHSLKTKKPYEYCLDFEYGNSAYEALNPIERYLAYKSTGVKIDKDKQNLSNAEKFCLNSLNTYGDIPDCDGSDGRNALTLDVYKNSGIGKRDIIPQV